MRRIARHAVAGPQSVLRRPQFSLSSSWSINIGRSYCTAPGDSSYDPSKTFEALNEGSQMFTEGDFEGAIARWDKLRMDIEKYQKSGGATANNDFVVVLNNLACAHGEAGRISKKKELLEDTLGKVEDLYGKEHLQYGVTLYNLGAAHGDLGDYQTMRKLLDEALELYTAKYGANHAKVARVLLLKADALEGLKLFEEQKVCMETATTIIMRHCGANHPQTAVALSALGKALGNLGDFSAKLRMLEKAHAIEEKKYGEGHPQLCMSMNNRALAHGELGEFENKKNLLEQAIDAQKKSEQTGAGGSHQMLASTYCNYANVFGEIGDMDKQLEWHKFALRFTMEKLGSRHPQMVVCLNNCASTYLAIGDAVGAEKVALSSIDLLDRANAPSTHIERQRANIVIKQAEELSKKGGQPTEAAAATTTTAGEKKEE